MKTLSNRFWLILLAVILAVSGAVGIYFLTRPTAPGDTAIIYMDGQLVDRVDLTKVTENYTKEFTGASGITNTVEFAQGQIRVAESTCPDHVCVYQGWIEANGFPIACLPNTLIIQVIAAEDVPLLDQAAR